MAGKDHSAAGNLPHAALAGIRLRLRSGVRGGPQRKLNRVHRRKPSRREDGRVIRFACPGCKSVLAGQDEHAGKAVVCPKCGQRMRVPRPPRVRPEKKVRRWKRPLIAGIALAGLILLAGVGGFLWLRTHFPDDKPEPIIAESKAPPLSSRP